MNVELVPITVTRIPLYALTPLEASNANAKPVFIKNQDLELAFKVF